MLAQKEQKGQKGQKMQKFVSKIVDSKESFAAVNGIVSGWNFANLDVKCIESGGRHLREHGIQEVAEVDVRISRNVTFGLTHSRLARKAAVRELLPSSGGGTAFFEVGEDGFVYKTTHSSCEKFGNLSTLKQKLEAADEAIGKEFEHNPNFGGAAKKEAFRVFASKVIRKIHSESQGKLSAVIWDDRGLRITGDYIENEDTRVEDADRKALRELKRILGSDWRIVKNLDMYSRGDTHFVCEAYLKRGVAI